MPNLLPGAATANVVVWSGKFPATAERSPALGLRGRDPRFPKSVDWSWMTDLEQKPAAAVLVERPAGVGRDDSSTNGSLREARLQRQLSGDEIEEASVAARPNGAGQKFVKLSINV